MFFNELLISEMELPVSSHARTLYPLIVITLQGRDSGLGDVKQHDITVQKLIIAARRETEKVLIPLASFPLLQIQIHTSHRILLPVLLLELHIVVGVWIWEGVGQGW